MTVLLAFAFVAGVLTILSPCALPVIPLLLGSGGTGTTARARRLSGILLGFAVTFVAVTVLLASLLAAAGLTTDRLRLASALLLAAVGAVLVVPALGHWLEARAAPLQGLGLRVTGGRSGSGLAGGLVLGAAIGLIWAPCVGPIMAGVIAVAVTAGPSPQTLAVALAYVAGAAIPFALVAASGRALLRGLASPVSADRLRRGFGLLMVTAALVVALGLDVPLQAAVATALPDGWGSALVAVEDQPAVQQELAQLGGPGTVASELPASVPLEDLGRAPELTGITAWINSDPLALASLRGKVVLVHFWTFACINCIHVQPYVEAWYERYAADGFVVIGVHTPELSFERDLGNVRQAVADDGVTFPVAFDPGYRTWAAYGNRYWPAFYFIDRQGHIRHTHFGEGDYAGSEQVIRELLAEAA